LILQNTQTRYQNRLQWVRFKTNLLGIKLIDLI